MWRGRRERKPSFEICLRSAPLQQVPEQHDPVEFRMDLSGSPGKAMSEVWSQNVWGGEGKGMMGAGRQQVWASSTLGHGIRNGNVFEKLGTWS